MRIDGSTRFLGLVGQPVAHSLSPEIQNHALERLGENLVYLPFEIEQVYLSDFVRLFPKFGGVGWNVTTPHKQSVAGIVRAGEDEVACTGVVNTVTYQGAEAVGWSTDGLGFRRWMEEEGIEPKGGRIVLLGFGATARSLTYRLGAVWPVTVVTRRPRDTEQTLQSWEREGWRPRAAEAQPWEVPLAVDVDLLVAGLPIGCGGSEIIADRLSGLPPAVRVVDLNYGPGRTRVFDLARQAGLTAFDGTGLLVHQAALSLSRWLGREVGVDLLREGLTDRR